MNLFLNKTILTFLLLTVFGLLLAAPVLAAESEYKLLESIPGGPEKETTTTFPDYLNAIFKFAIAGAAILAIVMIVIGGLQYVGAAGNTSVIEDAKDQIYWAVTGLFLALGSFLILKTISPEFLNFELGSITPAEKIEGSTTSTKPFRCYIQFKTGASTELSYTNKDDCQKECLIEKLEKEKNFVDIETAYCYGKDVAAITQILDFADCELLVKQKTCDKTSLCKWSYSDSTASWQCKPNCGQFEQETDCKSEKNKKFCKWTPLVSGGLGSKPCANN